MHPPVRKDWLAALAHGLWEADGRNGPARTPTEGSLALALEDGRLPESVVDQAQERLSGLSPEAQMEVGGFATAKMAGVLHLAVDWQPAPEAELWFRGLVCWQWAGQLDARWREMSRGLPRTQRFLLHPVAPLVRAWQRGLTG